MSNNTKFCTNCGTELSIESKFCPKCGTEQTTSYETLSQKIDLRTNKIGSHVNMFNSGAYYLENLFSIHKVTSRATFWFGYLDSLIVSSLLSIILFFTPLGYPVFEFIVNFSLLSWPRLILVALISFIMAIIVIGNFTSMIRRLHDTDRSGGYLLLLLIPIFGIVILFAILAQQSNSNGKRFEKLHTKKWHTSTISWLVLISMTIVLFFVQNTYAETRVFNQIYNSTPSDNQPSDTADSASYDGSSSSSADPAKLIHWDGNKVIAKNGTIEVIKEGTGDTTDGKTGVLFMYKITNTSNKSLSPNQIMQDQKIVPYQNINGVKKLSDEITPDDFQDLSGISDSEMAISDAIYSDDDNWDKSQISPGQSTMMTDGDTYKVDNSEDPLTLKIEDAINDVDGSIIDKRKDSYNVPTSNSPIQILNITQWNG